MENLGNNISTYEESSKIPNDPSSNFYQGNLQRISVQPEDGFNRKSKINSEIDIKEKNKNNESLPIKGTISTYNFKVVLVGNIAVGKSSIIKRYINNKFNKTYFCTVGTELFKKSLLIDKNKEVNLYIWDTCGQERFRTVTRQYYRDTQAILLVFDLTNENSFKDLNSWYDEAFNYINITNCIFFLIGNKCDEAQKICIDDQKIKNFMRNKPKFKEYFQMSAFNGQNINFAFNKICHHLVNKFSGEEINKNMREYKKKLQLNNNNNLVKKRDMKCC